MKMHCMDFSACRILTLEVEAVTNGSVGKNGLKCLIGNCSFAVRVAVFDQTVLS